MLEKGVAILTGAGSAASSPSLAEKTALFFAQAFKECVEMNQRLQAENRELKKAGHGASSE